MRLNSLSLFLTCSTIRTEDTCLGHQSAAVFARHHDNFSDYLSFFDYCGRYRLDRRRLKLRISSSHFPNDVDNQNKNYQRDKPFVADERHVATHTSCSHQGIWRFACWCVTG